MSESESGSVSKSLSESMSESVLESIRFILSDRAFWKVCQNCMTEFHYVRVDSITSVSAAVLTRFLLTLETH